jgi:hypothetical protein
MQALKGSKPTRSSPIGQSFAPLMYDHREERNRTRTDQLENSFSEYFSNRLLPRPFSVIVEHLEVEYRNAHGERLRGQVLRRKIIPEKSKVMNEIDSNQHYVSEALLKRFRIPGNPLQCYQIDSGQWKSRSTRHACSSDGYNQLRVFNELDNTLEKEFSRVESKIGKTFKALEAASIGSSLDLPESIYDNLCRYCAFLWRISPFAKATSMINMLEQVHLDFKNGKETLLRDLGFSNDRIEEYRKYHFEGKRLVLDSENVLQLVYRIQCTRLYPLDYSLFRRNTDWAVYRSPIELPISDVALVQFTDGHQDQILYFTRWPQSDVTG